MNFLLSIVILTALVRDGVGQNNSFSPCRTFEEIYGNGENLCNNLWGEAFIYVPLDHPEYDLAYTMWFFERENPNDVTTRKRLANGLHQEYNNTEEKCFLQYQHREKPNKEGNELTACHPWEFNACCRNEIVPSVEVMREAYGTGFSWNRCGKMSQECERFFVQESCFYECDANAGLFRKYSPVGFENNLDYNKNTWEMKRMPIKGDYCDSFFRACRAEKFCAKDNGDIYSCYV